MVDHETANGEFPRRKACHRSVSGISLLLWAARLSVANAAERCLPQGILEPERRYISNSSGQLSPVRFVVYPWPESSVLTSVAEILVSEVLGYHVARDPRQIAWANEGIFKLAGCLDIDCAVASPLRSDVLLDTWLTSVQVFFDEFRAKNKDVAPEDLGSMGYESKDGVYVAGAVRDAALADSGLPLEYYTSYNLSFHEPQKYFDRVWDLPAADLANCSDFYFGQPLEFLDSGAMQNYLRWTGDLEGVIEQNGQFSANCSRELPAFWLAPPCRRNHSLCIPAVMSGQGSTAYIMQWATTYGIPMAITHTSDTSDTLQLVRNFRILFYWYEPDFYALDIDPIRMILPEHSPSAWASGDFRTGATSIYVGKLVSSSLRTSAPRVRKMLEHMKVEAPQLLQLTKGAEGTFDVDDDKLRESACDWLKANVNIWEQWIPVATECASTFGLADAAGLPVAFRAQATQCQVCPAGRFSMAVSDEVGPTYVCHECPAGSHQSRHGRSICSECSPGSFAHSPGQSICSPCERGSYVNKSGATRCFSCGPDNSWTTSQPVIDSFGEERWVEIEGASSKALCRCLEGRFLSSSGQCLVCMEGSYCPGSGLLELLPGHHSTARDPGSILRCFGNAARCPGGPPGTCAEGRDPRSPSCSSCLPNLQADGAGCIPCSEGDYAQLVLLGLLILLGTGALHVVLTFAYRSGRGAWAVSQYRLLASALCANQLITCAQLFLVMEQVQGIAWDEPFVSLLQIFHVLSLDSILGALRTLTCMTRISPEVKLLLRTLLVPLFFAVGPLFSHLALKVVASVKMSELVRTLGFLFLLFYITLSSTFTEPFRCNLHPNGVLTLEANHEVFCSFSGTHLTMCVISAVVCLLPLSFLAICSYVLLVLLPRIHQADAALIRACSFLIVRFKPGFESFTILFLMRNLIFVLAPMMSASGCLFVMGQLLGLSAVCVAYFKPWRSPLASQMDAIVSFVLLMILLLSALTVADIDTTGIMILCTICASLIITGLSVAAGYLLLQHFLSKLHKQYAFFLCHHRASCSGFVRLLKLELKARGSQFNCFIDSDNLTDLSRLFAVVSGDTQTLVVCATRRVLLRPWCIGELTTGHLVGVDTIVLSFPDFEMPDDMFISRFNDAVPQAADLDAFGLGLFQVQAMLRWLRTLQRVSIGEAFSLPHVQSIVNILTKTAGPTRERGGSTSWTQYVILADPKNMDAMATAQVLGRFLVDLMPEKGLTPGVFAAEDNVSKEHVNIVLLLTESCFCSEPVARWLLQARVADAKLLPVIADAGFDIPKFADLLRASDASGAEPMAYAQLIRAIFLEVAPHFICSESSEVDLLVRSRQIGARLYGDLRPLSIKMDMVRQFSDADESSFESSDASLQLLNRPQHGSICEADVPQAGEYVSVAM